MKKQFMNIALVAAIIVAPSAYSAGFGGYVGVSGGGTEVKDPPSAAEIDAGLDALGYTTRSSVDDTDTGWKLFGGYKFNSNFAVEGSYADLGELSVKSIVTAPLTATVDTTWEATTLAIAGVGIVPLGYNFDIFGKVGLHYWDVELSAKSTIGAASASEDDNGTDFLYGIGADYNFTDRFTVRAEWEVYQNIGDDNTTGESDVEMWSAGLQYSF